MRHPVKAVHFQLTGRCNLACSFCGQNKGMLGTGREELPVGFWLRCAEETEPDAPVTFWGGEPLLYPGFEELAVDADHWNLLHDPGSVDAIAARLARLLKKHA